MENLPSCVICQSLCQSKRENPRNKVGPRESERGAEFGLFITKDTYSLQLIAFYNYTCQIIYAAVKDRGDHCLAFCLGRGMW